MSDFFQRVTGDQDPFKKLASYIPGFSGYVERQNRRDADKLVRDTVARRFGELWTRTSNLQTDLVSAGKIQFVDDLEQAARYFDRILLLNHQLIGLGSAAEVLQPEKLIQAYGGKLHMKDGQPNLAALDEPCCEGDDHDSAD